VFRDLLLVSAKARGEHDFAATDAEFELINYYFQSSSEGEGLEIETH